jgi:predicted CoA-substrate-specific enzyme activase
MRTFLGLDVGSVSTKLVLLDESGVVLEAIYRRTRGRPIAVIQEGLRELQQRGQDGVEIVGAGTTGSARQLAGFLLGADVVKNEITAHAVGTALFAPDVRTIIEIGGQDSKVILLDDGLVVDFAMNTVCAAGTGSFLDQQAARLDIPIEQFGAIAMRSRTPVRIAGRCTVFAESDMIHKQQMGHAVEDILYGLCQALARNLTSNLCQGRDLRPPVVFQGGVAANVGMVRAFEEALGHPIVVPPHFQFIGAIGVARLAQEYILAGGGPTAFRGFEAGSLHYDTSSFECQACPNACEIVVLRIGGEVVARWGGRCERWETI